MTLKKLTLLRDNSQESAKASKLLTENNIDFREVYSNSDRLTPSLMKVGIAYRGYNRISEYVNSLNPTHKQTQSN